MRGGRIVVGIDGSTESEQALTWALHEAHRHDADVVEAVMVWQSPYAVYLPTEGAPRERMELEFGDDLERVLSRAGVSEGRAPWAAFKVEPVVLEGPAAKTLVEHAAGADLLVVGATGHGKFAGMVLGSVSQHCATHAPCPVAVVRD
jgi:nucleotide-binding universal stress UspA family protein